MRGFVTSVAIGDAFEITVPSKGKGRDQCTIVCLCCERADQPMDDDGCGICDACLRLPVRENDALEGLEVHAGSSHLSLTTRDR